MNKLLYTDICITCYYMAIIAGDSARWTYGQVISTRSTDRCSIVSPRGTSTRSIPRSTASSNGTLTRSIGSVGADSSRGSIITWQTGSNVNWQEERITGRRGSEEKRERHIGWHANPARVRSFAFQRNRFI